MSPYSLFDVSLSLLFRCFILFFYRCAHAQWRFQPPNMSPYCAFWNNGAQIVLRALYYDVIITSMTHCLQYRKFRQISTMAERKFRNQRFEHIPEMKYPSEEKKKNIYHTKNTIKQIWKRSGPFGLIWRRVTVTLMFGLKLFLNEALEGFWAGARKQKSDGGNSR